LFVFTSLLLFVLRRHPERSEGPLFLVVARFSSLLVSRRCSFHVVARFTGAVSPQNEAAVLNRSVTAAAFPLSSPKAANPRANPANSHGVLVSFQQLY
jgi:hypothetical protein